MRNAACIIAALVATVEAGIQQPKFSSETALVRLIVSVNDDNGTVRGLKNSEFVVTDNGQKQLVTVDEGKDAPLDIMVVAQPKQSISATSPEQAARMFNGLASLFTRFQDTDRIGVILAGAPPARLRALQPGRVSFDEQSFLNGDYGAPFDAIAGALSEFEVSDRRQALIAFTAGVDFRSSLTPDVLAQTVKRGGPALIFVAAPIKVETQFGPLGGPARGVVSGWNFPVAIRALAATTGGLTVDLGRGDPQKLISDLLDRLRTQYVVAYAAPQGKGWHAVSVKVTKRGAIATSRAGYWVD